MSATSGPSPRSPEPGPPAATQVAAAGAIDAHKVYGEGDTEVRALDGFRRVGFIAGAEMQFLGPFQRVGAARADDDLAGEALAQDDMGAGLAQAIQCLSFQLTDTFTGNTNGLPDFFQGIHSAINQPIPQAQDLCFTSGEFIQRLLQLFLEQMRCHFFRWSRAVGVFHKIAKGRITFVINGGFQAHRTARDFQQVLHLFRRGFHTDCQFFNLGITSQFLK